MTRNDETGRANPFLNRRIVVLAALLAVAGAVLVLRKGGYLRITGEYLRGIETVIIAFAAFLAANLIVKFSEGRIFRLFEGEMEVEARIFLTKLFTGALYLVALAVVLSRLGIAIQNISIFLGLATTGAALAVRDVLSSHLVWIIILLKKPFRLGDVITCGEDSGKVMRIGTYFVTLSPGEGEEKQLKVPVKLLLDRHLVNHGPGGALQDQVSLPALRVPADVSGALERARREIDAALGEDTEARTWMGSGPMIHASYRTSFDKRRAASGAAVAALHRHFGTPAAPPRGQRARTI